ncbi:MAG: NfeD family protein [Solirubrobacterales bacterium]
MSLRGVLGAAAAAVSLFAFAAAVPPSAPAAEQKVPSIELSGELSPAQADWVGDALGDAESAEAPFAILRLDTPGGLHSAAEEIVDDVRSARIPVVVYVFPGGAEVSSPGSAIVDAADVAAMAPGTTLESEGNDLGENTALKQGRIDMIASDQQRLLEKLDGWRVDRPKSETLSTSGVEIEDRSMTIPFRILEVLVNPNVAYLLLLVGLLGLLLEALAPGTVFPGTIGAVALVLGLIGAIQLPVAAVGVVLLVAGAALIVAEANLPAAGALGLLGVAALIGGGLLIFDTSSDQFEVSPPFVIVVGGVLGIATVFVGAKGLAARREPVRTGVEELIGSTATVRVTLDPKGQVFVEGALWESRVDPQFAPVEAGYRVTVEAIDGLELVVTPLDDGTVATRTGAAGSELEGAS